jgi:hypothetical protein
MSSFETLKQNSIATRLAAKAARDSAAPNADELRAAAKEAEKAFKMSVRHDAIRRLRFALGLPQSASSIVVMKAAAARLEAAHSARVAAPL